MVLHTLATLYAELGRSVEAKETLLESVDRRGRDDLESHDWYVMGRLAENYGETEAARQAYSRVTRPADEQLGGSAYLLARKRVVALPTSASPSSLAGRAKR